MRKSYWLFLLVVTFGVLQSCDDDFATDLPPTETEKLVAPEVPPADFYLMSTTSFQDASSDSLKDGNSQGRAPKRNWVHAGVNLLFWHGATVLNSVIPLAAFGEALKQEPTLIEGKKFQWTYDYTDPIFTKGDIYTIKLTAEYINNLQDVQWIMTTSKAGDFTDFEWYSAIIATDFTKGEFTINHQPNNPAPYLGIVIERDVTGDNVRIRYTNIEEDSEGNGQYIEYRATSDETFNRAFDVQGGPDYFLQIQWNEETKAGQVKHPSHFEDDAWHCWDENQIDTGC